MSEELDHGAQRLAELATRLLSLTKAGRIQWSQGEGASYQYATANSSVVIRNVDEDGNHPYAIDVHSDVGEVVDSLVSKWVPASASSSRPPWNDLLEELFSAARRNVLNVDAVIDDLLSNLPSD